MIFYGTKGTHLKTDRVSGVKCNNCNEQRTHNISIFGRYFYLYWIPVFPISKKGISECTHCKVTYAPKEMSGQLKMAFDNIKRDTKTPIYYWIGAITIGISIASFIYSAKQYEQNVALLINSPKTNDIIKYESSEGQYSTLKITKVTTDSIYVIANSMEIGKKSKLYKIDKSENYNAEKYSLSLEQYKTAFKTKKFLN